MAEKPNPLQTYEWEESSIIPRADIRVQNKNAVAYLYAPDNDPELKLIELRNQCKDKGWATSSDTRNGKSVLRVSGLSNADELINVLESELCFPIPVMQGRCSAQSLERPCTGTGT